MTLSHPDFVAGQYRDTPNLEARIVLHRRFSTGEKPLPRWIFEQLDLRAVGSSAGRPHPQARPCAFSEVARVLSPGGCLYAATNVGGHMRELGPMRHVLDPSHPSHPATKDPMGFSLENGAAQLSQWLLEVSLRRYEGALVVTEAAPLIEYLLSGTSADAAVRRAGAGGGPGKAGPRGLAREGGDAQEASRRAARRAGCDPDNRGLGPVRGPPATVAPWKS